jgi:hypothetical protein
MKDNSWNIIIMLSGRRQERVDHRRNVYENDIEEIEEKKNITNSLISFYG